MLLEEGHCLRDQALEICTQANINKVADFSATSLETLRLMVAQDIGVTMMPALSVLNESESSISIRAFKDSNPTRQIALFWRKTSYRQTCFMALSELIRNEVSSLLN